MHHLNNLNNSLTMEAASHGHVIYASELTNQFRNDCCFLNCLPCNPALRNRVVSELLQSYLMRMFAFQELKIL